MESASYRLFDSEVDPASRAHVEVVTGITTEYGTVRKSGDVVVWNTEPAALRMRSLADRIEHGFADGGKVYRRRVIVVEDWTEVTGPQEQEEPS